jgi:ethanolamine utilization protein EutJ
MTNVTAAASLAELARLVREGEVNSCSGPLKVGVDLGTANIVLAVLDADNQPVAGVMHPSSVVRDGIVVDYVGAVRVLRKLKDEIESRLGLALPKTAATGIPPGIIDGNVKVIVNVVEAADFAVNAVIDEPTAAARVLRVREGAVVDVGGGTTGISLLKKGKVVFTDDEPTGGAHMTLVLAGAYRMPFEEAEVLKKDASRQDEIFSVIQPVVEKMAAIVNRCLQGHAISTIHVVGGACAFDRFVDVFRKETGKRVVKAPEPLLVTPMGIAMNCKAEN